MRPSLSSYPKSINKTHALSLDGLELLLDQIQEPVLILDGGTGLIVIVNSAFIKLTAFTKTDLRNVALHVCFSGLPDLPLMPGEVYPAILKRCNRKDLQVKIKTLLLDSTRQWLLAILSTEGQSFSADLSTGYLTVLSPFLALLGKNELQDFPHTLDELLSIIAQQFQTRYLCVYQAESDAPFLRKVATLEEEGVFPELLPASDLIRLSSIVIWMPGRRVLTELHKAGRTRELECVASAPIRQGNAIWGLLVAGEYKNQVESQVIQLLDFWAALIAFYYQRIISQINLQRERDQYQQKLLVRDGIFDSIKQGILVLGNDLSIVEINSSAEVMLGYAGREVIGQAVENVLIGPEGLAPALMAACQGVPTHNLGTVLLHRRSGQAFPSHVEIIPVWLGNEMIRIIVLIEDVSENEQIRLRTQQLEHRAILGEFTAVFAHEVRNPINNISTGLQLLAETLPPDDPSQEVINRMLNDCNRLNHLMESVLSFSRPMDTRFERVDLPVLVRRVLDRWRPRLAKVGVELFYQAEQNSLAVRGDPRALEQVFTNLISNAVEAMSRSGGHLAVRVLSGQSMAGHPQIEVTVSDNGPGIPEEIRERIFEPFVTASARGTGLGLAITKRIVTAHRGSITVNTFPGGTMFHVCLPAIEDDER